jgi:hypothetical protein
MALGRTLPRYLAARLRQVSLVAVAALPLTALAAITPAALAPETARAVPRPHDTGPILFAPYVQTDAGNAPSDLSKLADDSGQKYFTLGFLNSDGSCAPSWNGDDQTRSIKALQAAGGDVILSTGGANGAELAHPCDTPEALAAAYQKGLDDTGATSIDFDLEPGDTNDNITDHALDDKRSAAIAILQRNAASAGRDLHVSFTLAAAPKAGLPDLQQYVLRSAVKAGVNVDVVNLMTMDYGQGDGPMGEWADACASTAVGQLASIFPGKSQDELYRMIGITPMIGVNDTAPEVFKPQDAAVVLAFAQEHHIGRLSLWSINRDNGDCPTGGAAQDTCSGISQGKFDFTKAFASYSG